MKPYRRLQRLKQYIMDHYVFNLDLETWGLTNQKRELARFAPFLSPEEIAQSNALFGYQGIPTTSTSTSARTSAWTSTTPT